MEDIQYCHENDTILRTITLHAVKNLIIAEIDHVSARSRDMAPSSTPLHIGISGHVHNTCP